jgi:hypothetical protein
MSNALIGLVLGAGLAGWVYNKLMKTTGSNTQYALIGAGCAFLGGFVVMYTVMNMLFGGN